MPIILTVLKRRMDSPKQPGHEAKVEKTFSDNPQIVIGSNNFQTVNFGQPSGYQQQQGPLKANSSASLKLSEDAKAEVAYSLQLAVIDDPVTRHDEVLASQILSILDDAFPAKLSLQELKMGLPDFVRRTDKEWLLAIDALNKMEFIDGTFHRLGSNKMLLGAVNLQITEAGKEHARQTRSELTAYIRSESPYSDGLTDSLNRRRFERDLLSFSSRADRVQPLRLIMFDIDRFKEVNDRYGHEEGDGLLREIASLVGTLLGKRGECYRTGGDEFSILLPNHTLAEAEALAKRMCEVVSDSRFERTDQITVSAGVASLPETAIESQNMIRDADTALYKAKKDGGNRVYVCSKRYDKSAAR